jgi:signal transduction histidine kinase
VDGFRGKRLKSYSLTRRLVFTVLLVEALSAISMAGIALEHEHRTRYAAFDIMLRGRADTLFGAVQDAGGPADEVALDGTQRILPKEDIYEVRESDGRLLGRSSNLPSDVATLLEEDKQEIGKVKLLGQHYRVLRETAVRIVDPNHADGGTPRRVLLLYGVSTDGLWREIWSKVRFYSLLGSSLLILSGVLLVWLLHRSLVPLRELAVAASGVSVQSWGFEPPVAAQRMRELSPLATTLQLLLRGLERSFHQQDLFVSDAAHELKTAVAVMKSSLQLLSLRQTSPEYLAAAISRCETDCLRIESTVAQMLTLALFESDYPADESPFETSVIDVIDRVVCEFEPIANLKRINILHDSESNLHVRLAPESLRLLLSNLMQNSLQHSVEASEVRIYACHIGEEVELRVEDDGAGIDAESLPYVFNRFYRADASRSRNSGGTGLGLAICKALVLRSGGNIQIRSEVGVGTVVTVTLPS